MSTPNPTPSEKHTWVAASIHTCAEPDKRGDCGGARGLGHQLSQGHRELHGTEGS